MTWPSIQSPSSISEDLIRPQHKTTFETGRVLSRPKYQRSNYAWTLTWSGMSNSDLALLRSAFNSDQGTTFSWEHPVTGAKTVRYSEDSISFRLDRAGYNVVTVKLEED